MYLRCKSCGQPVASHGELLAAVKRKWDEALQKLQKAPKSERIVAANEAARYRTIYKSMSHWMATREYALAEAPVRYRLLRDYVLENKLVDWSVLDKLERQARKEATAEQGIADKEVSRIYGDFMTYSNRGADPTARAALQRLK